MESYRTLGGGSIDGYFGENPDWSKIKVKTGRTIWSSYDDNTLQAWLVEDTNSGGVALAGGNYANPIQIAGNGLPRIAGYFVDGFVFENPNQVGVDASGNSWQYIGTSPLPYTVTAGTVPSAPDYELVFTNDHNNLANRNAVGAHDATAINFKQSGTSLSVTRALSGKLEDRALSIRDFGAVCDGVNDDTSAVLNAISVAGITGIKCVDLTYGKIRFTSEIVIPRDYIVFGRGYSTFPDTANTILLKDGDFVGVKVLDAAQLKDVSVEGATGNGDDGVALLGGRGVLQNVSSFRHGQDGFKIGSYNGTANNANLWRAFNLISESNGRHGLYASDDNGDFNCNAGLLVGYDSSSNAEDGLHINLCGNSEWYGVTCQVNDGYGIVYDGAKGNYIPNSYTEDNSLGEVLFTANSGQNMHLGVRSSINNGGITNLGSNNMIWSRNSSFEIQRLTPEHFNTITISGGAASGRWNLSKDDNRNLLIDLENTTATAYLWLGSDGREQGLRISDGSILRKMRNQGTTLNFGTVAANSTSDQTMSITGITSEYGLTLTATHALPAGVIVSAYFNGTNVVARCANVTGSPIAVSGSFRLTAVKIGA